MRSSRSGFAASVVVWPWVVNPLVLLVAGLLVALVTPSSPAAMRPMARPVLGQSTGEACTLCHQPERGFTHPVGVTPTFKVPSSFPLLNGKIGCVTCHDPGTTPNASGSGIGHAASLRSDATHAEICMGCHRETTGKAMHRTTGRAHLRWADGRQAKSGLGSADIDHESRSCMACHDGTIARDVSANPFEGAGSHEKGHPLGTVYRDRGALGHSGHTLVPRQSLDSRIRLFDGQIGCGSCHSHYSGEQGALVMSNRNSRLCFGCHQM